MVLYTISIEGSVALEGTLQQSVFDKTQITRAGGRRENVVTVDLTNFLPDGTHPRDLCSLKCVSFVCEDSLADQTNITNRTGSVRLLNVAAPFSRSGNLKSGVLVGHIFATAMSHGPSVQSHVWRLSNPFVVTCQQPPNTLEVLVSGPRHLLNFGMTLEIDI